MRISEFKMWLDGVLAFNEDRDSWKPTAKQWAVIYEKIKQLEEAPPVVQQIHQNVNPAHRSQLGLNVQTEQPSQFQLPIVNQPYSSFAPEQLEQMKQNALGGGGAQPVTGIIDADVTKDFV